MKRTASAVWLGSLKQGTGSISTASGTLRDTPYGFSSRFENGAGTNPEELIAAAHAGCFTMATSAALGRVGFTPEKLSTDATVTLEQVEGNWTITAVHLQMVARVPGISAEKFAEIAADAKANCPVSRVLKANITLDAELAS
jgi:osmotically inducible protein OsmC